MRLYRFRVVKPPSELVSLREHECSNDAAAATRARSLCDGHNVEVWRETAGWRRSRNIQEGHHPASFLR